MSAFPPCLRPLWSRPLRASLPWATHKLRPVPHLHANPQHPTGTTMGRPSSHMRGAPVPRPPSPPSLAPHLRCPSVRPFALNTWENSPPPPAPGPDQHSLGSAPRGSWRPPHQALPPPPPTHCLCLKAQRTLPHAGLHSCASGQVPALSRLRGQTRAQAGEPGLQPPHVGGSGGRPWPGRPTLSGRTPKALLGVTAPSHALRPPHTEEGGLPLPPRASYQEKPWISRAGLSLTSLPRPPPPPAIITAAGASAWEA